MAGDAICTVLVTGAGGFIGRNLCVALRRRDDLELITYDLGTQESVLDEALATADVIFHLAGVNRPGHASEFEDVNSGFTKEICSRLLTLGRSPKIVLSSSIQAELENSYGRSKREAEGCLLRYSKTSGGSAVVYRLSNVFGKWSRPEYNSVVATFCHRAARGEEFTVNDSSAELQLTHVSDVVTAFESELATQTPGFRFAKPLAVHAIKVGELADLILQFAESQRSNVLPDMSCDFKRLLYSTFLSYLSPPRLLYGLVGHTDDRGSLAEFLKGSGFGQLFVSRTHSGVVRGNHYHDYKVEKFFVLEGTGLIRLRRLDGGDVHEFVVKGENYTVIEIPPGYTHSIENVGEGDLLTLFWCSDVFDPVAPDTYFEAVRGADLTQIGECG